MMISTTSNVKYVAHFVIAISAIYVVAISTKVDLYMDKQSNMSFMTVMSSIELYLRYIASPLSLILLSVISIQLSKVCELLIALQHAGNK